MRAFDFRTGNRRPVSVLTLIAATISTQSVAHAQDAVELDPIVINANRMDPVSAPLSSVAAQFSGESLASERFNDITDALAAYPGFTTYRRTHTHGAHPTTQGVRLRNLGANATSRALVLYDGVPQNDPFGAWVYWHQFALSGIESVSVNPSGSGEIWGNYGSGGVISLVSAAPIPRTRSVNLTLGSSDRIEFSANATEALSDSITFDLGGRFFTTDGFYTLREDQRGAVDERAFSESGSLGGRIRWNPTEDWQVQFSAKGFDESRGNGTALTRNDTEALNVSLIAERALDSLGSRLNVTLYHQDWSFENVFSSVSDDRSSERPALDQYDVPSYAFGGAVTYRRELGEEDYWLAGVDFREASGGVHERYRNLGDGFQSERFAGGKQRFIGAFGTVSKAVSGRDRVSATLRIDEVENFDARRVETDIRENTILRNDHYDDRSDSIVSANLRWRHEFSDTIASYATLFNGFRAPTLNELYRPYRVRNDITESNPLLANERQQGVEFAIVAEEHSRGRLRLALFHYEVDEMITNALITEESGFDPRFGFIPEGGSGSLRANLDKSRVSGAELQGVIRINETLTFESNLVFADTKILEDELSQFEGEEFPQSAPFRANVGFDWSASEKLTVWTRYNWNDRMYENLGNTTRIPDSSTLSLGAHYTFNPHHSIGFAIDNALDERIVSGIATNGLVTIDAPAEFRVTWNWRN